MDLLKTGLILGCILSVQVLFGCRDVMKQAAKGENIAVEWQLFSNEVADGDRFRSSITLRNGGDQALEGENWALYFNFRHDIIEESTPGSVDIQFRGGDFYQLTPTESFSLPAGEEVTIEFEGNGNVIRDDRAPAGLYFVFTDEQRNEVDTTAVKNYTFQRLKPEQVTQALSSVPDGESRYRDNDMVQELDPGQLSPILPTPSNISIGNGQVTLNSSYEIHYASGLEKEATLLAQSLGGVTGADFNIVESSEQGANIIALQTRDGNNAGRSGESYNLNISASNGILIEGNSAAGVFYGVQSLLNALPPGVFEQAEEAIQLQELSVEDEPRFPYRGMHLDVSRNFNDKEAVLKLVDLMAHYKLNKLHFHLTDDEGWRIAIEELPELTELGAYRGHTLEEIEHLQPAYGSGPYPDPENTYGSGYYTRDEYKQIIKYAHDRHIEVIPEFDVPGHARAAIKAMEARYDRLMDEGREEAAREYLLSDLQDKSEYLSAQEFDDNVISVCQESSYRFFETVVDDVMEMHREAGVPLNTIHMGGDEVPEGSWEKSPVCNQFIEESDEVESHEDLSSYFVGRLSSMLSERDLTLAGWQEIALSGGGHDKESTIKTGFADEGVTIYSWDNFTSGNRDLGYRVANAGYPVVLCNATNLYFELAYNRDPAEPGDYFGGFVDTRKAFEFMPTNFNDPMHEPSTDESFVELEPGAYENIKGMQAHLWSEPIKGPDSLEYFYAPKILGLAERAWAPQPEWETISDREQRSEAFMTAWNRFANIVGQIELSLLDHFRGGYNYRLPLPGAIVEDGMLHANVEFPGLEIRYTTDGSTPTRQSDRYTEPVDVSGEVKLRTFDSRGRGSRVTVLNR